MDKQIYDSRHIRWFESRKDINGKIATIAIPFISNKDCSKLKNIFNGKEYSDNYNEKIISDLNLEYGRNSFMSSSDITSVVITINNSSISRLILSNACEVKYKDYYTKSGIVKLSKMYESAMNKIAKETQKRNEIEKMSLKARDF